MFIKKSCIVFNIIMCACGLNVLADTVGVPDIYSDTTNTFDVSANTTVYNDGTLVVFEGQISLSTNISAALDGDGNLLASTQINVNMALFSELPDPELFTNSQGAVLGLFDTGSTEQGTLYALTDISGTVSWVQLTNSVNSTPIPITAGTTNLITVVMKYPYGSYTDYEYTVAFSELVDGVSSAQTVSLPVTSVLQGETGINGITFEGEGSIAGLTSVAGDPSPLSASIDFAVYQNTNGVFVVELYTTQENGEGSLSVYAYINGDWTLIGSVQANGSGSYHYYLNVTGLSLGEQYSFRVVDEEGKIHASNGQILVKNLAMQAVKLESTWFGINFNAEANRQYRLVISSDVNAPINEWQTESVQVFSIADQNWSDSTDKFYGDPNGTTQIRVPRNYSKAFFKILMLPEEDDGGGTIP